MIYAGTGGFLQECRENLEHGNHRSALVMLREAVRALIEDYAWHGAADKGIKGKLGMAAKKLGTKVKGALGRKVGLDTGGQARKMAQDAHAAGHGALMHGHKTATDAHHAVNKSLKHGVPHHADGAAAGHDSAVKGHQAVMTKMKRVMDQANKEGDHETANWAAQAGAEHAKQRAFHLNNHSKIKSELQKGTYSAKLAKPGQPAPAGAAPAKKKKPAQQQPQGAGTPQRPQAPAAAQGAGRGYGSP